MKLAVVVPTMSLRRMTEGFHERVHSVFPDSIVVYVLNGPTMQPIEGIDVPDGVQLVSCVGVFNDAVVAGLRHALTLGVDAVVRMDTEEHPPEVLPAIVEQLGDCPVWVVDLSFEPEVTIRPGTADSYHNLHVIPTVVSTYARENLLLSGAHGFMVLTIQAVAQVLPFISDVVRQTENIEPPVIWGADTLLPVCATKLGFHVSVTHVPAESMRDRPEEKCLVQLRDTLTVMSILETLRLDGVVTSRVDIGSQAILGGDMPDRQGGESCE